MKVALIFPPAWAINFPPPGIACIAEILKSAGAKVDIFDWNIDLWHALRTKYGTKWDKQHPLYWDTYYASPAWQNDFWEERRFESEVWPHTRFYFQSQIKSLIDGQYDVIGFSLFNTTGGAARQIIRKIKQTSLKTKLIIGGPTVSDLIFSKTLKAWFPDVDAAVIGEGETPTLELLKAWTVETPDSTPSRVRLRDIPGLAFLDDGTFHTGEMAPPFALEGMPAASFDAFQLNRYQQQLLPISVGRGCVNACTFCSECKTWKPFRVRPARAVVDDLEYCLANYEVREFLFLASVFNGDHQYVRDVCDLLIERNLPLRWSCNGRLADELDAPMLELMAQAGCASISFGLESGSDAVLSLMAKKTNSQLASRIIRDASRFKIGTGLNVIVGFPGETEQDFEQTLAFVKEHAPFVSSFSITKCTLAPGSAIHKNPKRFGILADDLGALAARKDNGRWMGYRHDWKYITEWATEDFSNTETVREQRHCRLLELLNHLHKRGNTPFDPKGSFLGNQRP